MTLSADRSAIAASCGLPSELLDGLGNAAGTGACVVNDQGLVTQVNQATLALLRRTADELVGQDAHDLLHRESDGRPMPRSSCAALGVLGGGQQARSSTAWCTRGDGSLAVMSQMVVPLRDSGALVLLYPTCPPRDADHAGVSAVDAPSELERLALLADTTTQLTSTLDVEEALSRLIRLVVPLLADWVVVDLLTERDEVRRAVVAYHDGETVVRREDLQGPMPPVPQESPMPLSRALRGTGSSLAGPHTYQGPPDAGIAVEQRRLFEATGMRSAIIAPIRGLRAVLGALTLGRSELRRPFEPADLPLLEDITRRTGLALDNARLYQRQRRVAETMQRHLLPTMPRVPGLEMTARYLSAPDASNVGGDWYDSFNLSDQATALVIGDVAGHDLEAAAGMAQLRNMLRAYAWWHQDDPSAIVTRLDQAMNSISDAGMATLVLGRLSQPGPNQWRLEWTNAGHPPPLLVTHDGLASYLTGAHGPLLGLPAARTPERSHATCELPPRSTLLLYTDGLVESRQHGIDHGLERLRQQAAALARRPLADFCDTVLANVRPPENEDDVALLALRVPDRR